MEYTQQIELKEVVANDEAIFFKVNVNGEDRIFVGQQNSKFDLAPESNLSSVELSDKLSAKLKIAESFQKSYLVDKPVQNKENIKKDVIIPCAVSKEIVQLGNYLYSLSKETNNSVLYLLYKNRLINRYVDDKMHCIYYDIDLTRGDVKDLINATAEKLLRGEDDGGKSIGSYPGLISNFNLEETTGKYLVHPLEKTWVDPEAEEKELTEYKNMDGIIEALEDGVSVKSSEGTMPYNLIYEYCDERQYETDASNIYADFIHLKNSLSPFFNVEVEDDYKFRLWRKFLRANVANGDCLYTIYSLDTPKTVSQELNSEAYRLNVGNNINEVADSSETAYYPSVAVFADKFITDGKVSSNFNQLGFTIHLDTTRQELVDRFMFSYNRRAESDINSDESHLLYTTNQFFNWVVDTSDDLFYWKSESVGNYPDKTKFIVSSGPSTDLTGYTTTIECIDTPVGADGNYTSSISVAEVLKYQIPPFVDAFYFNYDSGEIIRGKSDSESNSDNTTDEFKAFKEIYRAENVEDFKDDGVEAGPIINWEGIHNEGGYGYDGFILNYSEDGIETKKKEQLFAHKTTSPEGQESTEVLSDNWAHTKQWTINLFEGNETQKSWVYRILDSSRTDYVAYKNNNKLKLTEEECANLFPKENEVMSGNKKSSPSYDEIVGATDITEESEFGSASTAQKVKFLLTKLLTNLELDYTGTYIEPNNFEGIINYQLCNINGYSTGGTSTSLNDLAALLDYYANYKMYWRKGDKVKYTNYRISPYKTTLRKNDSVANANLYYGNEVDGNRISYFATPFELRKPIGNATNSTTVIDKDPELTDFNTTASLIDLFGLSIAGKSVEERDELEGQIVSFFVKNKTNNVGVDLVVSLKDERANDKFKVELFLNGQLVNSTEYSVDDENRSFILTYITSLSSIRFWSYGKNKLKTKTKDDESIVDTVAYAAPFNYNHLLMWNYPLSIQHAQQLRRKVLERDSLTDTCSDIYAIIDEVFTKVPSYTSANVVYSKSFNINSYKTVYNYAYDRDDAENMELQKLFKVQDFEFIDRIYGLNKLSGSKDRKSNLYSIRIKNSGFAMTGDETDEEREFKTAVSSMLSAAVNTICEKVQPINTKLYSVIIES